MTSSPPPSPSAALHEYLDLVLRQTPALAQVVGAFRPLKAGQEDLKASLPDLDAPLPVADPARLAQGIPLARVKDFLDCAALPLAEYLEQAWTALRPALEQGFPRLGPELEALDAAWQAKTLDPAGCLRALLEGEKEAVENQAGLLGMAPASLEFVLLQLAKPWLEQRAQALAALLPQGQWTQGSCPVCGSLPEMAYLQKEGGQLWLRCSLCAHHWRFERLRCPVCGNREQKELEFFYAQGREGERVDCCHACGKYLVTLDIRALASPPVWAGAALGLVHLDLLAQERGLFPAARCAWNLVR